MRSSRRQAISVCAFCRGLSGPDMSPRPLDHSSACRSAVSLGMPYRSWITATRRFFLPAMACESPSVRLLQCARAEPGNSLQLPAICTQFTACLPLCAPRFLLHEPSQINQGEVLLAPATEDHGFLDMPGVSGNRDTGDPKERATRNLVDLNAVAARHVRGPEDTP